MYLEEANKLVRRPPLKGAVKIRPCVCEVSVEFYVLLTTTVHPGGGGLQMIYGVTGVVPVELYVCQCMCLFVECSKNRLL